MMHQVMLQAAEVGGELVLALLFVASIVAVAIVSDRVWFFVRHRIDADLFARQLLQALHSGDLQRSRAIAGRSRASICLVTAAGLSQVQQGLRAMAAAMRIAKGHERLRMEGPIGLLGAIGQGSLLAGLLGTIFDLMQVAVRGNAHGLVADSPFATTPPEVFAILTPAAAGLLVAIPAMFAARLLRNHVRQTLCKIDSVSQLLVLQLREARRLHSKSTRKAA